MITKSYGYLPPQGSSYSRLISKKFPSSEKFLLANLYQRVSIRERESPREKLYQKVSKDPYQWVSTTNLYPTKQMNRRQMKPQQTKTSGDSPVKRVETRTREWTRETWAWMKTPGRLPEVLQTGNWRSDMRVGAPFQDQIVQIVPRVTENATINQREQGREHL